MAAAMEATTATPRRWLAVLGFIVASQGARVSKPGPNHIEAGVPKAGHAYFFSVGDFGVKGCEDAWKSNDSYHGKKSCDGKHQFVVADAMEQFARGLRPEFVLSLGDNFYSSGVTSLRDRQLNSSFEHVYGRGALANVPWKVILGDHDHCGNVSALIDYTWHSPRWQLPSLYHRLPIELPSGGGSLELILLDSIGLEGGMGRDLTKARRFGGEYTDKYAGYDAGNAQWEWLRGALGEARAGEGPVMRIVASHRPVLTLAKRSRFATEGKVAHRLRHRLRSAAGAAPVLLLSGHDHTMQHLKEPGRNLHYMVNGVGGMKPHFFESLEDGGRARGGALAAARESFVWGSESHGFAVHEVGPASLTTHFIDARGLRVLYSQEIPYAQ